MPPFDNRESRSIGSLTTDGGERNSCHPTEPFRPASTDDRNGAPSPIRRVVSHRLQSAETGHWVRIGSTGQIDPKKLSATTIGDRLSGMARAVSITARNWTSRKVIPCTRSSDQFVDDSGFVRWRKIRNPRARGAGRGCDGVNATLTDVGSNPSMVWRCRHDERRLAGSAFNIENPGENHVSALIRFLAAAC